MLLWFYATGSEDAQTALPTPHPVQLRTEPRGAQDQALRDAASGEAGAPGAATSSGGHRTPSCHNALRRCSHSRAGAVALGFGKMTPSLPHPAVKIAHKQGFAGP